MVVYVLVHAALLSVKQCYSLFRSLGLYHNTLPCFHAQLPACLCLSPALDFSRVHLRGRIPRQAHTATRHTVTPRHGHTRGLCWIFRPQSPSHLPSIDMSDDFPSLNGQGTSAGPSGSHYDAAGNSSSNAGPALSAAQALEQAHHGNANDGNTTAGQSSKASGSRKGATPADIDLNSESAFPSLGGASRAAAQTGGWAAKSRANAHSSSVSSAVASQAALLTESVTLPTSSINIGPPVPSSSYQGRSNNNNEASSLGAVLQMLRAKYPQVKLEASTSTAKGTTTFLFKASRQQDIERVKQELRTKVVRKVGQ